MADVLIDSDVVIWHLRGEPTVVRRVKALALSARLAISVITRAEVLQGAREVELEPTIGFLDACENLPVEPATADGAAAIIRSFKTRGRTLHLADALIGFSAARAGIVLYTGNVRHFPIADLDVRALRP